MTIQDVFEAIGARAAGKMTDEDVHRARVVRVPRRRRVRRPVHREHDGDRDRLPRHLAARPLGHPGDARRQGERRRGGGADGDGARALEHAAVDILTREAFENAIAAVAGTGGSTNGVLHLLAIAREVGVAARARGLRHDLGADADRRRPEAGRPLRRHRPARGRRRRPRRARARRRRPLHAERARRRRPHARRRRHRRSSERPGQDVVVSYERSAQGDRRHRDPARLARARGLRRQARRPRARCCTAARRASSTARRRASPRSRRARSSRATWS